MTTQTEQHTALTTTQKLIDRTFRFLGLLAAPATEPRPTTEVPPTRMNAGLHPDLLSYDWGHMDRDRMR